MKLVVGLGNPTGEYADTRHNVGFQVTDALAARWQTTFSATKFKALLATAQRGGAKVGLVQPQTYMNLSGDAVGSLARYYRVEPEDVFVVYDDVDLPLGRLRLRAKGSAGTHNGMKSLVQHLGTTEFPRLRVGIGRARPGADLTGHVLGKFAKAERPSIEAAIDRAADCVERVLEGNWDSAMSTYNAPPEAHSTAEETES